MRTSDVENGRRVARDVHNNVPREEPTHARSPFVSMEVGCSGQVHVFPGADLHWSPVAMSRGMPESPAVGTQLPR
jgi:hypothetical protein